MILQFKRDKLDISRIKYQNKSIPKLLEIVKLKKLQQRI